MRHVEVKVNEFTMYILVIFSEMLLLLVMVESQGAPSLATPATSANTPVMNIPPNDLHTSLNLLSLAFLGLLFTQSHR